MDALTAIETRASARVLIEPAPDEAQLNRLLRAGAAAPDHGRLAPWQFRVLRGAARARLGAAMAAARAARDPACGAEALAAEAGKAMRAPLIVAVAARAEGSRIPHGEQLAAVAACVQNICLGAHAMGFAANWKTGPAAYDAGVKRALEFAPADEIVALLYLGTPKEVAAARPVSLDGKVVVLGPPEENSSQA